MDIGDMFWKKWLQADELEKVKLTETLWVPGKETCVGDCVGLATLLNSYFVDLVDYLNREGN